MPAHMMFARASSKFVLYKRNEQKPKIELVKKAKK